jgi:hypothetical protein
VDVPTEATAFDTRGADLSHHDGDCSFERILKVYELDDPALERMAEIVHEADIGDDRFDAPEAPGIELAVRSLAFGHSDLELLERSHDFFEGMYSALRS